MANFISGTIQAETNLIGHGFGTNIKNITAAATTTTLVSTDPHTTFVSGSTLGQIVALPDATTTPNGQIYWVINLSSVVITTQQFGGTNPITIFSGGLVRYVLKDNSTTAGVWHRGVSSSSPFAGTYPIVASYSANAGVGRFLEFWSSNPSDSSPFLIVVNSTIVGMSIVSTASSTGTVTIYKNADFVTVLGTLSLTAQTTNSTTALTIPVLAGDRISLQVTSGSVNKPGVALYIFGS